MQGLPLQPSRAPVSPSTMQPLQFLVSLKTFRSNFLPGLMESCLAYTQLKIFPKAEENPSQISESPFLFPLFKHPTQQIPVSHQYQTQICSIQGHHGAPCGLESAPQQKTEVNRKLTSYISLFSSIYPCGCKPLAHIILIILYFLMTKR